MRDSTIAALATPPGTGALALIRISGREAVAVAERCFVGRRPGSWVPRMQHFGRVRSREGQCIDEVLLTYFPGPASHTGEDVVEICCHGGVLLTRRILDALFSAGAEPAQPGEFSQRAFLNGKIDLTQAEAVMDLISARTDLALKAANEQLQGRIGEEIGRLRRDLIALLAHVEAYIDFPEEDIEPASKSEMLGALREIASGIGALLATADQGRILREGIRTVICGAPNAGKSSLLNRLLGYERAIVNAEAGTTRDTLEEIVNLKGIPLRLIDTAGIRETSQSVEKEGIERTRRQIENAELVIQVADTSRPKSDVPEIDSVPSQRMIRVLNKSDLPGHPDWENSDGFRLSCLSPESLEAFRDFLFDQITERSPISQEHLCAINARHQHWLQRALGELETGMRMLEQGESPEFIATDLRAGLDSLGEIVGKTDIEEILGEIFSRFCIGK